ncbi:MAG: bacterial proteasome activator family protein [Acidimicrobiales bacterium]|nr:bacterial proteasome activator family protein [Acidimicrobiales bacterium]
MTNDEPARASTPSPAGPPAAGSPDADGTALHPEVVEALTPGGDEGGEDRTAEAIERPAKVLRIGSMVKQLLEEVRQAPLDEASRDQLRAIYERSLEELKGALSPDLADELDRISVLFDAETPSEPELRIAQAQLVGWLEGLFHGIQATLVAQQVAARAQLDEMRQRSLPPGSETAIGRPGTYL